MHPISATPGKGNTRQVATNESTRDRIINYLEENRTVSIQALSRAWNLTRADIRYHINAMLSKGIIELVPRDPDQPVPRGRPEKIYRLAARSLPDNFPGLCSALLDTLLCPLPIENREPALRTLAGRMAGSFVSVTNLTPRLNQATAFLNEKGYRARWEAHAGGPRISLRTCPYIEILSTHPELCLLDRFLLEHLVRLPFQQVVKMDPASGKPGACIFASGH